MPNLDYRFITQYGFDPYNPATGEIDVTNDNLVISAWFAPDVQQDAAAPLVFAGQVLPNYVNTSVGASEQAASKQSVKSRHSARYLFEVISGRGVQVTPGICLVLNPPPEYKQQMQGAIVYNGGDPYDVASYTVKKPLQANYLWEAQQDLAGGQNLMATSAFEVIFGTYPPNTSGFTAAPVQLLKTNGADGVAPVFFDFSSSSGVKAMIDAVNAGGEYYLPFFFNLGSSTPDAAYRVVKYPHSVARG